MDDIKKILESFDSVSLKELECVSLLDRMDSKFVFAAHLLPEILQQAKGKYRVLTIENETVFTYRSLYFDTCDNKLYLDHHNGKSNRFKVRFRTYVNTGTSYLEIKFKTKNGRTLKKRIKKENIETVLSEESKKFINENIPIGPESLEPKIYSTFLRITLVNYSLTERVTIDFSLAFENESQSTNLHNIAIAEVKHIVNDSDFIEILKTQGIESVSMSKYCIGRILTGEKIKYNRFKPQLMLVNKIENKNDNR